VPKKRTKTLLINHPGTQMEPKATTQKANVDFRQRSINRKYRREESVAIWSKKESLYEAMPNEGGKRAINTASI